MYIKEVSIDGFKSYAQRVTLSNFDPGFNAITGLNGSGKSNILDSICFVMGIKNLAHVRASAARRCVCDLVLCAAAAQRVCSANDGNDNAAILLLCSGMRQPTTLIIDPKTVGFQQLSSSLSRAERSPQQHPRQQHHRQPSPTRPRPHLPTGPRPVAAGACLQAGQRRHHQGVGVHHVPQQRPGQWALWLRGQRADRGHAPGGGG